MIIMLGLAIAVVVMLATWLRLLALERHAEEAQAGMRDGG